MNYHLASVLLAGLCFGFTNKTPEPATATKRVTSAPGTAKPAAPRKVLTANDVTGRAAAFFARHNMNTWWRDQLISRPETHGFLGGDFYRIDVVFHSVRRDAQLVNVYHVRGKQRYKGEITAFSGTFTLNNLEKQTLEAGRDYVKENKAIVTAATGQYRFQLQPASRGVLTGDVVVQMAPSPYPLGPLGPCGFTFDGEWRRPSGQYKGMMWSDNLFALGNSVLGDFEVGERGSTINRKYLSKGWDTYWENEEWWTTPVARRK